MAEIDQSHDPFAEFINSTLDLDGIDGFDQAVIAEKMRNLLFTLPGDVTTDLWNEQLDSLQAVIRICLDLDMVLGAFEERLEPNEFNRDDLEILIMLAVTFSFVSYNRLRATYNVEEPVVSDDTALARRLRDSLQASMGWVKKAASDGDHVATRFLQEANSLLDTTHHLE